VQDSSCINETIVTTPVVIQEFLTLDSTGPLGAGNHAFVVVLLDILVVFLFMSGISVSIANGLLAYFSFDKKYYWISLYPWQLQKGELGHILFSVFEGLMFLTSSGAFIVEIYLNFGYIASTKIFLETLR
jgi:hypothetical protein